MQTPDFKAFHDVPRTLPHPNTEGAAGIAFVWVLKFLSDKAGEIPTLALDEYACPAHTAAYRQGGKLWLMGPVFYEWLRDYLGASICPKLMVRYLMALDAKLTYVVFSPRERYPVIRLPREGTYAFGRESIILRGAVGGGVEQPSSN